MAWYKERIIGRFDLASYMEISMDLQVAVENVLQDYKIKSFDTVLYAEISMDLPVIWYQVISDFDPGMCT